MLDKLTPPVNFTISPIFNKQLFFNYFAKKLQSQTVIREKHQKTLLWKKSGHKMLIKLTHPVNFTNILQATFF